MKNKLIIMGLVCVSTRLSAADLELHIAKLSSRVDQLEAKNKKLEKTVEELQHFQTWPQGFVQYFKNRGNNLSSAQIYFKIRMPNQDSIAKYVEKLKKIGGNMFEHVLIGKSIDKPITISVLGRFSQSELESLIEKANKP